MSKKEKNQKQALQTLGNLLGKIQQDVKRARLMIDKISNGELDFDKIQDWEDIQNLASKLANYNDKDNNNVKIIEWVYDGYFMVWSDDKKYPVPLNYASKTKLIPGDALKLRIKENGQLIYKLIWPAKRKHIKATLSKDDTNKPIAITDDGETYKLNPAAVSYYKWEPWDEASIIINADGVGDYGAMEAVIKND